jgi:hypothetical protein
MGLGTTETVSSICLAMVPPGNILRTIAELRVSLWKTAGAPSARAWFDIPVLAWLGEVIDGASLAGIASRCSYPFELGSMKRHGDDVFLCFPDELARHAKDLADKLPLATRSTAYTPGPFEAGIGCYCATLPPSTELSSVMAGLPGNGTDLPGIRAKTFILAQIELRWTPGPRLESSWATLSSARAGRKTVRA